MERRTTLIPEMLDLLAQEMTMRQRRKAYKITQAKLTKELGVKVRAT
ncbi:MAG: hypothetical protein HOQ35_19590 [Acidobacteriaceae bacterium]|nr:hypothetical protein [Acidobacteriaceae bacterium]